MAIQLNITADDAGEFLHDLHRLAYGPVNAPERGVDDDDGTVDRNLTVDIDLDDGTWELFANVYRCDLHSADVHIADFIRAATLGGALACVKLVDDTIFIHRKRA